MPKVYPAGGMEQSPEGLRVVGKIGTQVEIHTHKAKGQGDGSDGDGWTVTHANTHAATQEHASGKKKFRFLEIRVLFVEYEEYNGRGEVAVMLTTAFACYMPAALSNPIP